ncbi:MAG: hypothetical protein M3463_17265, partial [Verrucomicrobiota bacterium]|nr:hypothetical protein [Verrucomicrobiota bacterium]
MIALRDLARRGVKAVLPHGIRRSLRRAQALMGESPLIPCLVTRFCVGHGIEVGPGKYPYC